MSAPTAAENTFNAWAAAGPNQPLEAFQFDAGPIGDEDH